jgi:glucokinase
MKRAVLVNGLPASGKSEVARRICAQTGWPLLNLDSIKEPFFDEIGIGDRAHNRALGRAAYHAIWSIIADAPAACGFVIDAWFGFQPASVLRNHIARSGVAATAEIWCHAPGAVLAERYARRLDKRHPGHPGADFVPELAAKADQVAAMALGPVFDCDTTRALDVPGLMAWLRGLGFL